MYHASTQSELRYAAQEILLGSNEFVVAGKPMYLYFCFHTTLVLEDNQVDIIVPPDDPPAATQDQIDSSVQLRLPNFQNSTVCYCI